MLIRGISLHHGIVFVALSASLFMLGCGRERGSEDVKKSDEPNTSYGSWEKHGRESELAALAFRDMTEKAGLADFHHHTGAFGEKWIPETMGGGAGLFDYDGDGDVDIVLINGGSLPGRSDPAVPPLRLYENRGDGTFIDRTVRAGLVDLRAYSMGVTAADYDGDGDLDIYVTALGPNLLLRNEGDGTFAEVAESVGVAGKGRWSTAAIFLDADGDGDLDLFVGNYLNWRPELDRDCPLADGRPAYCGPEIYEGVGAQYFRNRGDGTFTDQTSRSGLTGGPGKTLGAVTLDFNQDGRTDIAVANDEKRNLLYRNEGNGRFTEVGRRAGIAFAPDGRTRAGMGIDVGVIGSGAQESIVVGNFTDEMTGVFSHLGDGIFGPRSARFRIGYPSLRKLTFGLFFFDADLDRDLDLFATNGHIQEHVGESRQDIQYRQPVQLFINREDTFSVAGPRMGDVFKQRLVGRGAVYGDVDGDGDLDVLVTENGGPAHLWQNLTQERLTVPRFVRIRPVSLSGAPLLGTRVRVWIAGRAYERTVRSGGSYLSQLPFTATFGLGPASQIDSAKVRWPEGSAKRFGRIPAGKQIRITRDSGIVARCQGRCTDE